MTIIVTGDLHWNASDRDKYRHDFVQHLARQLQVNEARALLILGDLTQEKDCHSAWLVNKIFDHISFLSNHCPVIILKGNHDYLQPSIPFFKALGKLPRVCWANKPMASSDLDLPGEEALFLPHTRDHRTDWKGVDLRSFKFVFAHNTFKGAKSESGQALDGIPHSVFSKKQTVVSGDVHVPQVVGPIHYVGAPYHINFGDGFNPRLLEIYSSGKMEDIPYNGPCKVVMDLKLGEKIRDFPPRGDIVKVNIHLSADDRHEVFREYKDQVAEALRRQGCVAHVISPIVSKGKAVGAKKTRALRHKSDKKILEAYASSMGFGKSTLKAGIRLMRKT